MNVTLRLLTLLLLLSAQSLAELPAGWQAHAARDEIRPEFSVVEKPSQASPELVISAGQRKAVDGAWVTTIPVAGGKHYRFSASRQTENVTSPRRSALVRIVWQDDHGNLVVENGDRARPEYPRDRERRDDGRTTIEDTYRVPAQATQARVELRLRWTNGTVRWSDVKLTEVNPPEPRTVRLATVHFRPRNGRTNHDQCQSFEPFIEEAGRKGADLVCLPEIVDLLRYRPRVARMC